MNLKTEMALKRDRCNFENLPKSFEIDAVRAAFQDIKGLFNRDEISKRIKASRALTFKELYEVIK